MTPTLRDLISTDFASARRDQSLKSFDTGMRLLERLEADETILKTEHAGLRQYLNRGFEAAWSAQVREPFFNAGRYAERTPAETKLETTTGFGPQCHTAVGLHKRLLAATKGPAAGAMLDAMLKVSTAAADLAARVDALKDKIGKRAPAATKTSMERDERAAKAMTCQCCGHDVLAETGVIAHHGYERPGQGWQTSSCPGARELPFEVSRDALGRYIERLRAALEANRAAVINVKAEKSDITWTYSDRSGCTQPWHKGRDKMVWINRETLAAAIVEAESLGSKSKPTYDLLKAERLRALDFEISQLVGAITVQEARYAGWSQTHTRQGDLWVPAAQAA